MSTLTLIRHGQATPFEDDPDRLSELGQTQARMLGVYWLRNNVKFDEIYTGTLVRQQQTAQHVSDVIREAGQSWPIAKSIKAFNEYQAETIWNVLVPELVSRDPSLAVLIDAYERDRDSDNRNRSFQRALEAVMNRWQTENLMSNQFESWLAFRDRVCSGLKEIFNGNGSSRRVALFTSGGPIGTAIQLALKAPDRSALEVNWRVRNCSLTEFVFTRDRFSLDSFNTLPHLEDTSLWSYR